jgi:hypothetical protein
VVDQRGELHEVGHPEDRTAGCDGHIRIGWVDVGPTGGQAEQLPLCVEEQDPVLAPVQLPLRQAELAPYQRVEGVGDTDPFLRTLLTGRNRRVTPRGSSRISSATPNAT